ncbi:hypothetical protein D3C72_2476030 [compost metagenome]
MLAQVCTPGGVVIVRVVVDRLVRPAMHTQVALFVTAEAQATHQNFVLHRRFGDGTARTRSGEVDHLAA